MEQNQTKRYNIEEAARRLGMSSMSLRRKVINGEVSHYRPSPRGKIYFTDEHLREFENRRTFHVAA